MLLRPPKTLWLQKAGNRPEEHEDASSASYPYSMGAREPDTARVAVADGASESAFAREWARLLTREFVQRPPDLDALDDCSLREWLAPARREWRDAIPWDRIPWHGLAKAQAGAFATLLGVTVSDPGDDSPGLRWEAVAVGDCCLFVVQEDRLILSFPLEEAGQFDSTPALLCSNSENAGEPWEGVSRADGRCRRGDLLVLASDALACWFLEAHAGGGRPWETLQALEASEWPAWVDEQRRAGAMRNDDTTLMVIEVA